MKIQNTNKDRVNAFSKCKTKQFFMCGCGKTVNIVITIHNNQQRIAESVFLIPRKFGSKYEKDFSEASNKNMHTFQGAQPWLYMFVFYMSDRLVADLSLVPV